jgi:hypothetical protein
VNLKALPFETLREQIGYCNDMTIVYRKYFDKPQDIRNYDYQQTNNIYKKYCESQEGILYGVESNGMLQKYTYDEYFYPVGRKLPPMTSSSSEFGDEAVCIRDQSAIFVKTFKIFYETCSFFCDYPSSKRNIEHAELTLTNNSKILDGYTRRFNTFIAKHESNMKKEIKDERVKQDNNNQKYMTIEEFFTANPNEQKRFDDLYIKATEIMSK